MINKSQGAAAPFAMIAGMFYLIDGIWGLFSPITFGVLSTNLLHTIIHIAMGVLGIYAARTNFARMWCIGVGLIVLPVGVLYFVPGISQLLVSLFNVNQVVSILNVVAGITALLIGRLPSRSAPVRARSS